MNALGRSFVGWTMMRMPSILVLAIHTENVIQKRDA
jgi:hypothetical protein